MLQLNFHSISEDTPGKKWQTLFQKHWPAYKAWFQSKGVVNNPDLATAQAQLEKYMPKFMPTYKKLCELAGNDPVAARFLTGYQPPAYITGCSQAVYKDKPQLVRNYDYHPNLCEGTLLNSAWNGKHVIAIGDCLWGVVDGMNTNGLVASLTFGGRKVVGKGFGIPFILRYVLEFCSTVDEALEELQRIPTHMAYNVMVLDKTGTHAMLQLAPDHEPIVTKQKISTNHQGKIDWPEHARFSKTVEREQFLVDLLELDALTDETIAKAFLKKPLFNTQYQDGFGTIYTSVYRPAEGYMELRWLDEKLTQSFADFTEGEHLISYSEKTVATPAREVALPTSESIPRYETGAYDWEAYGKAWQTNGTSQLTQLVVDSIGQAMGIAGSPLLEKLKEDLNSETKKRGQVPWEMLADLWTTVGKG
ncbi:C45 family autoproteolytic acyltransferase/hydolase [Rasiella sp. SM2506]|uniref:C45 family autoproteolytic acyltransferase/hydolase n=1 Tax=Rasiella sp. SM2506 TaxID=3423914 RepID=UPI003D7BC81C